MAGKKYALGVDMGGTLTKFGLVDDKGNILREGVLPTTGFSTPQEFVHGLSLHLQSFIDEVGKENLLGLGIGAPNANFHTGEIDRAANLPWKTLIPLRQMMIDALSLHTVVTNDAKAAAWGEMHFGAAKNLKDFMVITLGTGLGSGIVANGQIIYGHDGLAGEVGHIIAKPDGRPCGCGRRGCLETYASVTGIMITAREVAQQNGIAPFTTPEAITQAAMEGNPVANEIFKRTGLYLGTILANVTAVTSPEAIIFFGGLANARDFLLVPTQKAYEDHLLFIYKNKTKFLVSQLMNRNAAILGAAALVF